MSAKKKEDVKKAEEKNIRAMGYIKIVDTHGGAYLPKRVREEVDAKYKEQIPYFMNANSVLLIRKGATREDVLKGLDILKEDLQLRWKK